jgi:transcription elongation factor Elf1
MKTIGPISYKAYQCTRCNHEESHQTNHWGSIYNIKCKGCAWKNPMEPFSVFKCTEDAPEGYALPEEWKPITITMVKT